MLLHADDNDGEDDDDDDEDICLPPAFLSLTTEVRDSRKSKMSAFEYKPVWDYCTILGVH